MASENVRRDGTCNALRARRPSRIHQDDHARILVGIVTGLRKKAVDRPAVSDDVPARSAAVVLDALRISEHGAIVQRLGCHEQRIRLGPEHRAGV